MEFKHIPVLLDECINALNIMSNGVYADLTVGGAGHSIEIAKRLDLKKGRLICFDRDEQAILAAKQRLEIFDLNFNFIHDNFTNFNEHMNRLNIEKLNGALIDLGVSSHQLDTPERGFSFHADAPLDMRMNPRDGELSAYDVVNDYDEQRLVSILYSYGEEKYAKSIAKGIIRARAISPVGTTGQLAQIIKSNVPLKVRREKNPCRKTFQAIRIEVNGELSAISDAIPQVFERLAQGGRLAVLTFHSIEDRLVKNLFKEFSKGCSCPPDFPICVCAKKPRGKLVSRKPIAPSENELSENARSRSAKLRVIEVV
ncbi:MAG: 16S rRNA (cytosine(1402)-N(4))-methyltransferase RsmH [Oscillospiraceae bacterium]|nr:16S rRNA (cytosine(1402)-N(4))-methyltransferase RsmH [Oscillospiraceae bacterium]